jgi:glycosyltransferase involved in cell wall biosynthesis
MACINELNESYPVEIFVIHWPVNKEAPFKFSLPEKVHFYDRKLLDFDALQAKISTISPEFIFCSGWVDKEYLRAARGIRKKIPVVIGIDNQWLGTLKQYLACIISRIVLKRIFTHCWLPGIRQEKYARKLGFKTHEIVLGSYSADVPTFKLLGEKFLPAKTKKYPHVILYAGRYNKLKGIKDLWNAFILWQNEQPTDWELWCIGTGAEKPAEHPKIKHFGFIQPEDMPYFIENAGIFVLPSLYEPWGLVLHEFAAAGFPLICSNAVGASDVFLKDGENGFIFKARNMEELKRCFKKITSAGDETLVDMGNKSRQKAVQITPATWARAVMGIIGNKT